MCGHGFSMVANKANLFIGIQRCKLLFIKVSHLASREQNVNASSLAGAVSNTPRLSSFSARDSQFSDTMQGERRHPFFAYRTCTSTVIFLFTPLQSWLSFFWLFFFFLDSASYRETCNKPCFKLSWVTAIKDTPATGLRQVGEKRCICVGKRYKEK